MREFLILWFERLLNIAIILMGVAVVISGLVIRFQQGLFAGLAVWLFGALNIVLLGGAMYLGLGIYQNTKRTADAVEKLAARG